MRKKWRSAAGIFLLCVLLLFSRAGVSAAGERAADGGAVLLLPHPNLDIVKDIATLYENGILPVPGLKVVGIYHEKESEDYGPARRYIEEKGISWMEIGEIECGLTKKTVYAENGCTPVFRRLFGESDGILFNGGPDIPPSLYKKKKKPYTLVATPKRHYFEISFLFHLIGGAWDEGFVPLMAARPDYAVFGICLGMQSINVAAGGTLVQDIPLDIYGGAKDGAGPENAHRMETGSVFDLGEMGVMHLIKFVGDPDAAEKFWTEDGRVMVLSIHHQAVGRLGEGLVAAATSADGRVVEMLSHKKFRHLLGVQFHPEKSELYAYLTGAGTEEPAASADAGPAEVMREDAVAREFHESLWRLMAEYLMASAGVLEK